MTYQSEVAADAPLHYYRFENSAALGTMDASATGTVVPTIGAAVTSASDGILGSLAADFAGTSGSYMSWNFGSGNYIFRPINVWTYEAWVKLDNTKTVPQTLLIRSGAGGLVNVSIAASTATTPLTPNAVYLQTQDSGGTNVYTTGAGAVIATGGYHHVVVTSNGTTLTLYVDGVSIGTQAARAINTSSFTTAYVGSTGTTGANSVDGRIDELAFYSTALSSTRVTAHYNAGGSIGTAGSFGVSAHAVGQAKVNTSTTGSFTTAFGSGTAVTVSTTVPLHVLGEDEIMPRTGLDKITASTSAVSTTSPLTADNGDSRIRVRFDLSSIPSNAVVSSAILRVRTGGTGTSISARRITSGAWTPGVYSTTTDASTNTAGGTASGVVNMDATNLINAIIASGSNNGFAIRTGGTSTPFYADQADDFRLMVDYTIPPTVNVTNPITAAHGDGVAATPGVTVGTGTTVAWGAAVANASGTTWVGSSAFIPDTIGVFGSAVGAGSATVLWSFHETASFGSASGAGEARPVGVNTVFRVIGAFGTARGVLKAPSPLQVNPSADPYFEAIHTSITTTGGRWYRLDETVAPDIDPVTVWEGLYDVEGNPVDAIYGTPATFQGTGHYNVQGPEGRQAIHITTGYIDNTWNNPSERSEVFSQELVIRTGKKTGTLWTGSASVLGPQAGNIYAELVNGRVRVANYLPGSNVSSKVEFTGRLDVADGLWHHIVVTRDAAGVFAIYVDGVLDIRRLNYAGLYIGDLSVSPDYYFGSPNKALPQFVGDAMEMAYYEGTALTPETAKAHSNAVFGIENNYFGSAKATVAGGDWIGKGNIPMALFLHFSNVATERDAVANAAGNTGAGSWREGYYDFGPQIAIGTKQWGGYQVEWLDVTGPEFIDEVTGEPRFRNLYTEADLSKYDMVYFPWWPDESNESGAYWIQTSTDTDYARDRRLEMLDTLRDATDAYGTSFLITNPQLAADFGVVDRVELVPSMEELSTGKIKQDESGGADPAYNPHANDIDPWAITSIPVGQNRFDRKNPDNLTLSMDYYYWDSHQNNRLRVRNLVSGLTDFEAWIMADFIEQWPHKQFALETPSWKYADRTENGLHVGDEFIFEGPRTSGWQYPSSSYSDAVYGYTDRSFGTWATPIANVKVGTVVTTYAATIWMGRTETVNPYKDYATSIAVEPGESVNGRPLGGKVFVDFTERIADSDQPELVKFQKVPENEAGENEETRKWQYSGARWNQLKTQGGTGGGLTVISPVPGAPGAGGAAPLTYTSSTGELIVKDSGSSLKVFMLSHSEVFELETVGVMATMLFRGLLWLADKAEVEPGSARAAWGSARSTGKGSEWITHAAQSAAASWGTARGRGDANIGLSPNAKAFFGTAAARGTASMKVGASFGTATGIGSAEIEYTVNFDATEVITLFIETGQVTLYMEEE